MIKHRILPRLCRVRTDNSVVQGEKNVDLFSFLSSTAEAKKWKQLYDDEKTRGNCAVTLIYSHWSSPCKLAADELELEIEMRDGHWANTLEEKEREIEDIKKETSMSAEAKSTVAITISELEMKLNAEKRTNDDLVQKYDTEVSALTGSPPPTPLPTPHHPLSSISFLLIRMPLHVIFGRHCTEVVCLLLSSNAVVGRIQPPSAQRTMCDRAGA